jgi:tetratricopeptide (TPR) repeat protein
LELALSLYSILHDPTWIKFDGAIALGSCGVLGLAALRFVVVRRRKKDIYQPAILIAETYAADETQDHNEPATSDEPVPDGREQPLRKRQPSRFQRRVLSAVVGIMCISVSLSAFLFALRSYIVLSNWQDGQSRDYIGDHVGAIVCYKKALRADPDLKRTHLLIGVALLKSDHVRAAIPELQTAAKDENSDPEPQELLGDAYRATDMWAEAALAYRQAAVASPRDPKYYIDIGGCMEKLHHPDIAYSAYDAAIQIDPRSKSAHIKLGSLLINTGHLDEGMAHLKKAIALAPNDVMAHSTLATAYARFRIYDSAVAEFRRAIDIDSKFNVAWFNLGVTLEHMNAWERALDAFKTCAKLTPRNNAEKDANDLARIEVSKIEIRLKHG